MRSFSILGDSISTFDGCNPDGFAVYYQGERCEQTSVTSSADTWWSQVIERLGGRLLANSSFSGSLVEGAGFPAGNSQERIDALAEKLAEMEKRRGESRKARAKTGMPVVSLVGYTNVGKSSLMNALCGPSVAEADMLFATLDPTSRKLVLPSGMAVLLVDTVGFVSRLPHNLVEAFKSTLEEAAWSDVIVRVADAGDEQREEQLAVTDEVLDGLDCADIPRLTVYNKCDKPGALSFDPDILLTSAKTGYGLEALLKKLDETLSDRVHTLSLIHI